MEGYFSIKTQLDQVTGMLNSAACDSFLDNYIVPIFPVCKHTQRELLKWWPFNQGRAGSPVGVKGLRESQRQDTERSGLSGMVFDSRYPRNGRLAVAKLAKLAKKINRRDKVF